MRLKLKWNERMSSHTLSFSLYIWEERGKVEESEERVWVHRVERGTVCLCVEFELSTLNFEHTQKRELGYIQMDPTFNSSSFSFRLEFHLVGKSLSAVEKSAVIAITLSHPIFYFYFFYHRITISFHCLLKLI